MGHFLALTTETTSDHLQLVADTLVTGLHSLAAPLPAAELDRRRASGLSDRQEALLQAWGYPHVMDQFKFHFSLSGSLIHEPTAVVDALATAAQSWFGALPPCRFGAVALFLEPARGQPMQWMGEWPLNGTEEPN